MRTIKFRGKSLENGEWVYGFYAKSLVADKADEGQTSVGYQEIHQILNDAKGWIEVKYNTVGQFTGLTDKNGKDIWEGDIVMFYGRLAVVIFDDDAAFKAQRPTGVGIAYPLYYDDQRQVVGNIHDNPELLK